MKHITFKPIYLEKNGGLGNALRLALEKASYELVARMDSDDISYQDRFEKQLDCFVADSDIDIVGGEITEFIGDETNITGKRTVEELDVAIKADMKKRCAMNHVSVMYKKSAVLNAGGYIDWPWNEDYYLWLRMMLAGSKFCNVVAPMVNVRVGDAMSSRRGGMPYFKSEAGIQKFMLENKIIGFPRYLYNLAIRFGGEVIATNGIRTKLFKFFRKEYKPEQKIEQTQAVNKVVAHKYPPFSVAMSVYGKDNAEWFDAALASIVNQTVKPTEIVLVVDGPIPESIQRVIDKYTNICWGGITLDVIYLSDNAGLGNALKVAIDSCSYEIVARMDSDDIAVENRFEQQLDYMERDPDIDCLGGDIEEFISSIDNISGKRTVPVTEQEIASYIKKRCPFNHMTVMYKRSAVQAAGGYLDWFWNEDYYLWIRMYLNGCHFANTGTILVHARVGKEMYQRRGGKKYYESEKKLQRYMLKNDIIKYPTYVMNCAKRFIVQVLLPNKIRGWVFRKFARRK